MSDRIDDAIDRAVREMLDVEPPADLRARVLARLPASAKATAGKPNGSRLPAAGSRPASGWVLVPLAAAALILLAIFVAQRSEPVPPSRAVARANDVRLPAQPHDGSARDETPIRRVAPTTAARSTSMPPRGTAPRTIAAAHAVDDTNVSAIPALDGPAALSVAGLDAPAEVPLRSIVPEPMRVRALELDPLTTTPPDRREE